MLKEYLLLPFLLFTLSCNFIYAQKNSNALNQKTYEYLQEAIDNNDTDTLVSQPYLKAYLNKAKADNNHEKIAEGYRNYIYLAPFKLKFFYADSMVTAALKTHNTEFIGGAYLSKGIVYYQQKKYSKALDEFITGNNYLYKFWTKPVFTSSCMRLMST